MPEVTQGVEKPLTRFEAQRKLGLFAAIDYTILGVIAFAWITLGFWKLFGDPTAVQLLAMAVLNVFLTQIWAIILGYRALVFILDMHSEVALMPDAAARIVVGFWEGRKK